MCERAGEWVAWKNTAKCLNTHAHRTQGERMSSVIQRAATFVVCFRFSLSFLSVLKYIRSTHSNMCLFGITTRDSKFDRYANFLFGREEFHSNYFNFPPHSIHGVTEKIHACSIVFYCTRKQTEGWQLNSHNDSMMSSKCIFFIRLSAWMTAQTTHCSQNDSLLDCMLIFSENAGDSINLDFILKLPKNWIKGQLWTKRG